MTETATIMGDALPAAGIRNVPTGFGRKASVQPAGAQVESSEQHRLWMHAVAARRDRQAFGALFGHFAPRIKAYLMRSGSDADQAEELVQECMTIVWRKADSFDPAQASVATWMFTIARNKRIDGYRRARRPELDPEDPALLPEAETPADRVVEASQVADRLARAMATLPVEQAEMLRMAFYEDKAHSEIAAETNLPLGTVKSRLRLAMGRMRKALGVEE